MTKCPSCKNTEVIKKGKRKTRLGSRQLYYCKSCKKGFADSKLKVSSQLYWYALGLSFRTSIPLENFICAWFDEKIYYEFRPTSARVKL